MLLLIFQLAGERCGLDAHSVLEVASDGARRPLEGAPRGIAGWLSRETGPIPVVDLSEVLVGSPARSRLSTRILVVPLDGGDAARTVGLRVEGAQDARQAEHGTSAPGASGWTPGSTGPVIEYDDGPVRCVRLAELLSPEVREALRQVALPGAGA